jgi:drug/metabolite transporter (DMT)-like permease
MLGALLALASAGIFGMTSAALRRGVLRGSVLQGLAVTVPLGVPLFALALAAVGGLDPLLRLSLESWLWMTVAGVLHFALGRYGNYRATRAIGAAQSAPMQQLAAIVSLVLALAFLGEHLTPLSAIGVVLVIAGPAVILWQRIRAGAVSTHSGITFNYAEGYFWGMVCALSWGTSPLLIRYGLAGGGIPESVAGGLISYAAASLVIGAILLLPGNIAHMREFDRPSAGWFAASGALTFVSQMFRYMALAVAPVSIVAPILQTTIIFRLICNWLVNRQHEVFGASVLLGVALSLAGVLALTVSIDVVADLVPLPDWLAEAARMRWP